jgi:predicted dinucleotide-binding enzyme
VKDENSEGYLMQIGIIGTGNIGGTIARKSSAKGKSGGDALRGKAESLRGSVTALWSGGT